MEKKQFNFIGVCLGNPTFTDQHFWETTLMKLATHKIDYTICMFDKPFQKTLQGLGYTERQSELESNKKVRYTKNKIIAALQSVPESGGLDISYVDRERDVASKNEYVAAKKYIEGLYNENTTIRSYIDAESEKVLMGLASNYHKSDYLKISLRSEHVRKPSEYILDELAFFFSAHLIFQTDTARLIYPKTRQLLHDVFAEIPLEYTSHFSLITLDEIG